MSRLCRVLVADPSSIFRAGVRDLLGSEPDLEAVEAGHLDEVLRLLDDDAPQIVLLADDLFPGGIERAVELVARRFQGPIVVWGPPPKREVVLGALRAGAAGYLRKDISATGLLRSLRGVLQGEVPIPRDLVSVAIEGLREAVERERIGHRLRALSPREQEILDLIAGGGQTREIAGRLEISQFTVKRHVQNILQKLELPTRAAAASIYRAAADRELATSGGVR